MSKNTLAMKEKVVASLQAQLAAAEAKFEPLRKRSVREGPEWESVAEEARIIRKQLWDLTGDAYGRKKTKTVRPSDDVLQARYDAPEEVPQEVMAWVRSHAALITSDATDAVRWARIVDTARDDRYPKGEITIYRAVADGEEVRPGDWVTTERKYAEDHLARYFDGKGQILEATVDGEDVLVSPTGNFEEAIYAPMELSGPIGRSDADRGVRERG